SPIAVEAPRMLWAHSRWALRNGAAKSNTESTPSAADGSWLAPGTAWAPPGTSCWTVSVQARMPSSTASWLLRMPSRTWAWISWGGSWGSAIAVSFSSSASLALSIVSARLLCKASVLVGGVHGREHLVGVAAVAQVAVNQVAGRLLEGQVTVVAGPQEGGVDRSEGVAEEPGGGGVDRLVGPGRAVPGLAAGPEVDRPLDLGAGHVGGVADRLAHRR